MLGKIKGAVEREDHFEIDDGSGRAFKVAKAALSPHLADRVRELYCGGKVQHFMLGGEALMPPGPHQRPGGFWDTLLNGESSTEEPAAPPAPPTPLASTVPTPESTLAPVGLPLPPGSGPALSKKDVSSIGADLSSFFSGVAKAQVAPKPVPTPTIPTAPLPSPISGPAIKAPPPAEPAAEPVASPVAGLREEARAAGVEAARKIAEAGNLAKQSLDQRAAAEAQGRAAEMAAAEGLVRAQDEATRRAEDEAARMRDVYARGENALRLQKEKLAAREKELLDPEAMRIETGRVFSRADPVGLMVGAMMVGAAEAGLRKGSGTEAALKVIGDAIDRDVLAQKTEKGAIQSARFRAYEAAIGDANNAAQLLKADQQLAASAAARAEAQRTQSAQGRLMLTQLSNSLSAQARKTAEDAVQLITGQALAQQKAAADAEARTVGMRQAEFALAKGAADLENMKRDNARADESLALSKAQLGIALRREQREAAGGVDFDVLGKMGAGLSPAQFAQIKDDKASASYVQDRADDGSVVYRRAVTVDGAKDVRTAQLAAEAAKAQLARIEKYIPGPGKSVTSRFGYGEKALEADAEVEAATEALKTQLKEIERLGALTGADLALLAPRIPTAQAWFKADATERKTASTLRNSIDEYLSAIKKFNLTTPMQAKGGQ